MGSTHQEIEIDASPDAVWQTIRDFHDLSWAPNVISSVDKIGETPGNEPGAGRVLNGAFHETLLTLDDADKTCTYSIDDGPSPIAKDEVNNYVGVVKVTSAAKGNGSRVEWSSSWENNDEAGAEFCHPIYVALLADMKNSLE